MLIDVKRVAFNRAFVGTSLAIQWLRLRASTAGGVGSTPGLGSKIPPASQCCQTPPPTQKPKTKTSKQKTQKTNNNKQTNKNHGLYFGEAAVQEQGALERAQTAE